MIRSFADPETDCLWNGERSRKLPSDIQKTARRKLRQLDAAERLNDMASPRGNRLEQLKDSDPPRYSIRITTSGESASTGTTEPPTMSGSRTTTRDEDLLDNVHPGDILREDFLIGSEIPVAEVSEGAAIPVHILEALLECRAPVDADIDLRLGRYFGMSEGFFLRLQNSFDLEEVRRARGRELDRIVPRAA